MIYLKKESGFTLVEILVAMILMAMVLLGSFLLALNYRGLLIAAETRTAAINFAENIIEDYRHRAFDELDSINHPQLINSITRTSGGKNIQVRYTYRVAVANLRHTLNAINGRVTLIPTNAAAATMRRVTVTVTYNTTESRKIGADTSVELSALIPRN